MTILRNTTLYVLTVGIGCLAQAPASSGWVPQASPTAASLRSVAALDANTVVAVGSEGRIVRTTDGGAHWNLQPAPVPYNLNGVSFSDANTGAAVGDGGTILWTTDGGITWTQQSSGTTRTLCGISLLDPNHAIAVGIAATISCIAAFIQHPQAGMILRTTDGGLTWTQQTSSGPLWDVSFLDTHTGVAVGGQGLLLRSIDGGVTWKDQTPTRVVGGGLRGVSFTDANTGTVVGGGGIFHTIDGGVTWKQQAPGPQGRYYSVHYTGTNAGTVVGDTGILRTIDGGLTWKKQILGMANSLFGVVFTNGINGWAVGDRGLILHTVTGGESSPIAVSSASLTPALAAESLGSLLGPDLAQVTATADPQSLPTRLGGISLNVRDSAGVDRLAPLLYVSPTQINFQVPSDTSIGDATLELLNAPATVPPLVVPVRNVAPGLFILGNNIAAAYGVRVEADGTQTVLPAGSSIVLDDRVVDLVVYGTGFRNRSSLAGVKCTIGGIGVPVEYAGPGGAAPGLDQVNVRLTAALKGNTDGHLVLAVDGVAANVVLVDVH